MNGLAALDRHWFLLIDAAQAPSPAIRFVALALAQWAVWTVPLGFALAWLRGSAAVREALLMATFAALLALAANQAIALAWYHPRPLEAGIGRTWLAHAPDSSFPSDHLTFLWSVAIALLGFAATRRWGALVGALGLPVAWARIYLGVHFPLDMAGAALVAGVSAGIALSLRSWAGPRAMKPLSRLHTLLFAPLIRRGWVRR